MNVSLYTALAEFWGDLCEEIRLFIPVRKIENGISEESISIRHEVAGNLHHSEIFLNGEKKGEFSITGEEKESDAPLIYKKFRKRAAKNCIFGLLSAYTGQIPPWGSLTGVRPSKLMRDNIREKGEDAAEELFKSEFHVSQHKIDFLKKICAVQKPIIDSITEESLDIYIGIPICVSKCAYCSFPSILTTKDGSLEEKYVSSLVRQIEAAAEIAEKRKVRSIYIGGGTPTALNAKQLARVLKAAKYLHNGCEYTIEAGRPDTIDEEKLALIREAGAARISVNAQTTCDATLQRIGRAHTAEDFFRKFELAKRFGFSSINCDLIVGLPGEDEAVFEKSLSEVMALGADNITVHTLAIKRASRFAEENEGAFIPAETAEGIIESARAKLFAKGFIPYYMYRQKYMAGNLENAGYCLPGSECIYNVDIMEEVADILALGGGGISKRIFREEEKLVRAASVKDVYSYIDRTDEMIGRNRELFLGK